MPKKYHINAKVMPLDLEAVHKFTIEREKTASIVGDVQKSVFMRRINGERVIRAKWLPRIRLFVETAFGVFRNARGALLKSQSIETF